MRVTKVEYYIWQSDLGYWWNRMERRTFENGNVQLILDKDGGTVSSKLIVDHGSARSAVSLSGYRDVLSAIAVLESTLKHLIDEERREIAEAIDSSAIPAKNVDKVQ